MNPYIGYSPVEEEQEYECECGMVFTSSAQLKRHFAKCPENEDFDPEVYDDE